jgi:hypothetical protein
MSQIFPSSTTQVCPARGDQGADMVADVQLTPLEEYQTSFMFGNPPITQILLLKTTDVCNCRGGHGAASVADVQRAPSAEYQTSFFW